MKVFCDFDGTITVKDVGAQFFNTFMMKKRMDVVDDWMNGKITTRECLILECSLVRATKEEIDKLLNNQEIETSFINFVNELYKNNIELVIISDGFDYYINKVLEKYSLEDIKYYANRLILYDNNRVRPEFPYYDPKCPKCANCKGLQIERLKSDSEVSVYIGDGYSDRCAASYADVIFAKGDFFDYCSENNILCYNFNDFNDILKVLKQKYPSCFHSENSR
ncbi:MAG: MtnX-like HAD-IB family phosphatase [Candidatus Helarchaeota archaeon]|nr:MtnX-like HAD-IB family phosphatase [Candidatus Helarchaeota archaeon]